MAVSLDMNGKAETTPAPSGVADWVIAARNGDEEGARQLVTHLYPFVMRIVRAHLPRRTDAEDLAQATFLKMFRCLEQYAGKVPFEHWVARIAVNTCINQLRSERVRPECRMADLSEAEAGAVERLARTVDEPSVGDRLAARELVEKLLATLSATDRFVLTSLDLEGRTVAEIQELTGWGASLIKVRAFRARRKLRKQLVNILREQTYEEEGPMAALGLHRRSSGQLAR